MFGVLMFICSFITIWVISFALVTLIADVGLMDCWLCLRMVVVQLLMCCELFVFFI